MSLTPDDTSPTRLHVPNYSYIVDNPNILYGRHDQEEEAESDGEVIPLSQDTSSAILPKYLSSQDEDVLEEEELDEMIMKHRDATERLKSTLQKCKNERLRLGQLGIMSEASQPLEAVVAPPLTYAGNREEMCIGDDTLIGHGGRISDSGSEGEDVFDVKDAVRLLDDSIQSYTSCDSLNNVIDEAGDVDLERIYHSFGRPKYRTKTLGRLNLSPLKKKKAVQSVADVGVQVNLHNDYTKVLIQAKDKLLHLSKMADKYKNKREKMRQILHGVEKQLDHALEMNTDLENKLLEREAEIDVLQDHVDKIIDTNEDYYRKFVALEDKTENIIKENAEMKDKYEQVQHEKSISEDCLSETQGNMEKIEMDNAFLLEEKADLELQLGENEALLRALQRDRDIAEDEQNHCRLLLVDTKLKTSETLGHYLDQLNQALRDKKKLLRLHVNSSELKKMFTATEDFIELEQEKNRLVEQVEILTTQTVSQDMHIEDLQKQMSEMTKILQLYEIAHGPVKINPDGAIATPLSGESKKLLFYYHAKMAAELDRKRQNGHIKSYIKPLVQRVDSNGIPLGLGGAASQREGFVLGPSATWDVSEKATISTGSRGSGRKECHLVSKSAPGVVMATPDVEK